MSSLIGTVFQPGTIEFLHENNGWAVEYVQAQQGSGQVPRVLFDPKKVTIELQFSPNINPDEYTWLERVQTFLITADQVYLRPEKESLRFMQAIHEFGNRKQLITLGNQRDVDAFAKRFWKNIRFLYASRKDDFRFSIGTFVTNKIDDDSKTERIEIKSRMVPADDGSLPQIGFEATGHDAPYQIVDWRKTTEPNKSCRFAPEGHHVELSVGLHRQPLSFLHEYREEFKNHSFTFSGDTLAAKLKKIAKMRPEVSSDEMASE